jgi:hypothetical protein
MPEESTGESTIDVNYIKSNGFREAACDGVLGGPTPRGALWLAFFTERLPLPRVMRHQIRLGTHPGEVFLNTAVPGEPVEGRQGLVRNVEFGVYMSVNTAEQLHAWLGQTLQTMKNREEK